MKFFSIFLAYCILHIATLPCKDVHEFSKGLITTVIEAHENHEDHNDNCSPFCLCSCCQASVTVPSFFSNSSVVLSDLSSILFCYNEGYTSSGFALVWHPPKVS